MRLYHLILFDGSYCLVIQRKGERKNTIVVDEKAAETVRRIFTLAASGTTVSQIAKLFNEEKVITPSKYLAPGRRLSRMGILSGRWRMCLYRILRWGMGFLLRICWSINWIKNRCRKAFLSWMDWNAFYNYFSFLYQIIWDNPFHMLK